MKRGEHEAHQRLGIDRARFGKKRRNFPAAQCGGEQPRVAFAVTADDGNIAVAVALVQNKAADFSRGEVRFLIRRGRAENTHVFSCICLLYVAGVGAFHGAKLIVLKAIRRFTVHRRKHARTALLCKAHQARSGAAHSRKQVFAARVEIVAAQRNTDFFRMAQCVAQNAVLLHGEAVKRIDGDISISEKIRMVGQQVIKARQVVERIEIRLRDECFICTVNERDLF